MRSISAAGTIRAHRAACTASHAASRSLTTAATSGDGWPHAPLTQYVNVPSVRTFAQRTYPTIANASPTAQRQRRRREDCARAGDQKTRTEPAESGSFVGRFSTKEQVGTCD